MLRSACSKTRPSVRASVLSSSRYLHVTGTTATIMPRMPEISLATAAVGATVGVGYVAVRLLSSMGGGKSKSIKGGGGEGADAVHLPMFNMEEIAKRAVERKKSFLYTRSGDSGTSQLYNMERRPKNDDTFEALGNMDELNACIALAVEHCEISGNGLSEMLVRIQSLIIDASALVATPRDNSSARKINRTAFPTWCTDQLEACIDELDARTPPLKTFVVPGGGLAASHLHVCRCVCRRAERSLQPLIGKGQGVEEVARYVNRLSDLLFAAARYASMVDGKTERPWTKLPAEPAPDAEPTATVTDESTSATTNGHTTT